MLLIISNFCIDSIHWPLNWAGSPECCTWCLETRWMKVEVISLRNIKGTIAPDYITLFERVTCPLFPALKGIKFLFAACRNVLDTVCKIQKIRKNQRVLHAVVKYLPAACKRVADSLCREGFLFLPCNN